MPGRRLPRLERCYGGFSSGWKPESTGDVRLEDLHCPEKGAGGSDGRQLEAQTGGSWTSARRVTGIAPGLSRCSAGMLL